MRIGQNKCNGKRQWDLAIWGTYPPPWGGMGTHVFRLLECLQREGIRTRVYNRASKGQNPPQVLCIRDNQLSWFIRFALLAPEKCLYIFTSQPTVRFLAFLLKVFRRKRYILRIGEERILETLAKGPWFAKWMTRLSLRQAEHIVAVSPHLANVILQQGVCASKVHVIPGFIVPTDPDTEPPASIIGFAQRHTPILAANGQLWINARGRMYGVDLLFSIIPRILEDYPCAGFLFSVYDGEMHEDRIRQLRSYVEKSGFAECVYIRSEEHVFWPMLKYTDIFLRPTRSEGDSSSIREAIWLGVPVVASNSMPRPIPSVLFDSGDPQSFLCSIQKVLGDLPEYKRLFSHAKVPDNAAPIIQLIKRTLNPGSGVN